MAKTTKTTKTTPKKAAKKAAKKGTAARRKATKTAGAGKAKAAAASGPRIIARRSKVHGRGVFARVDIPKGERVIEYKGRRITWAQADRWYPDDDSKPSHTFLFTLDDDHVVDGNRNGNNARWINHSCRPNCESDIADGHIWIKSIRDIKAGDELFYDYNITLEERHTAAEKKRWPCWCGNKGCRGTLLGKKR
jgi:uncharacterized protein